MDELLKIRLPVYEGPLDLLLDLIHKQQIDVYDIPIAKITGQYLDYLRAMKDMDINLAGEFVLMAATLIYIKSKMLLPLDPLPREGEAEDPRLELVQRLLEYEKFKNAAQMLHEKELIESSTWSRAGMKDFLVSGKDPEIQVSLFDLVSTFKRMLDQAESKSLLEIERDEMSISQVIDRLHTLFEHSKGFVSLSEIFSLYRSKRSLMVAFLAILEMAYFHAILLIQEQTFGEILARRHENFENVMAHLHEWVGAIHELSLQEDLLE